MTADEMPIIPHELIGGRDCCGCIVVETSSDPVQFVCNECLALISTMSAADFAAADDVDIARNLGFKGPEAAEECPRCHEVNRFPGFDEMLAFVCHFCGSPVKVERPVN